MNKTTSLIGPLLQAFFTEHLLAHKRASPQTMAAYRDTFRLLLQFVHDSQGIEPLALRVSDLDGELSVGRYPLSSWSTESSLYSGRTAVTSRTAIASSMKVVLGHRHLPRRPTQLLAHLRTRRRTP